MLIPLDFTVVSSLGFNVSILATQAISGQYALESSTSTTATYSVTGTGFEVEFMGAFGATGALIDGFDVSLNGTLVATGAFDVTPYAYPIDNLSALPTAFGFDWFNTLTIDFSGKGGHDFALGSNNDDKMNGKSGIDILLGLGGDDILLGAVGDDFAVGGEGKDLIFGGLDQDVMLGDAGNDRIKGGAGNDIIDGGAGRNFSWGEAGSDLFMFDINQTGLQIIKDFDADDAILFAGVASTAGTNPEGLFLGLSGGTLADLSNGDIDGFSFRETAGGDVRINYEDQTVFLRDTVAADVLLDRLYFRDASAESVLNVFGSDDPMVLGNGVEGSELTYFQSAGDASLSIGDGTQLFLTFGVDIDTSMF